MASSIVRLEPNVPETIALKFQSGKEVDGNYGPQVLFSLADGRSLYADPNLAEQIEGLGVRRNEAFQVVKKKAGAGKGYVYDVRRVEETHQTPPAAATPTAASDPHPISRINTTHARLCAAYMVAIDVAAEAEAYSRRKGLALTPSFEDIRALAATIIIDEQRREGR